jgi:hypothetical protein
VTSDQSDRPDASLGPLRPEAPADPAGPVPAPATVPTSGRGTDPVTARPAGRSTGLAGPLLIYTALRVGLIALLTGLLMLFMPFIVALLFAIIVQLPLSWLLFGGPRRRVTEAMAATTAHRRAERERLRAALAGSQAPPDPPAG